MSSRSDLARAHLQLPPVWSVLFGDHLLFLVGVLAWRAVLDFAYVYLLFPLNEYFGFAYEPQVLGMVESYMLMFAAALILPARENTSSSYFLHVFFVLGIVPILSYYALGGEERWMLYALLFSYALLVAAVRFMPPLILPVLSGQRKLAISLMVLLIALTVLSLIARVGVGALNLDMSKVYQYREEVTSGIYSGVWAYLYSWVGGAVCVGLMVYFVAVRRYAFAFAALLVQIYMFGATGHKVYLFQPVIALGTYWLLTHGAWRSIMVWGLCTMIFAVAIVFMIFDLDIVGDLIVRRTLYVPAFLDFRYLEYFSEHPKVYLTNSFFKSLGEYPYGDVPTGLVIGNFIGFPDTNAVTGYLGTAYMNFGVIGMAAYSMLFAVVLRLLDGCVASGLPFVFVAAATVAPIRAVLTESDLFTSLLTHGLGLMVLLLMLMAPLRGRLPMSGPGAT